MAESGRPAPVGDGPPDLPPRPYPSERPLGADEPSAPFEEMPVAEPAEPGPRPDDGAGGPAGPGARA